MTSLRWLNGRLSHDTTLHPDDRGFLLGDGVFETLRGTRNLTRHLHRLRDGAALLGIEPCWTDEEISAGVIAVLNGQDAAVRITLSRGPGGRGVLPLPGTAPTLLITAGILPGALPPARLIVAQCTRRNEHSPLSRIKSLNYLDSILARQEAVAAGADDAILRNTAGDVAEATAANLFVLRSGAWVTPAVSDGALPGITRALLLESGFGQEARLAQEHLRDVTAAFLSGSLGLRAVASVDGRVLADCRVPAFVQEKAKQGLLF